VKQNLPVNGKAARFNAAMLVSALAVTALVGCTPAAADSMSVSDQATPQAVTVDAAPANADAEAQAVGTVKPQAPVGPREYTAPTSPLALQKAADFPPASPEVITAALQNCEPAPEIDPDADWLDIATELITDEEGYAPDWEDIGDGMWTIGYGHAIPQSEPLDVEGPLTDQQAADLLRKDLEELDYVDGVNAWFDEELPPAVYAVMVSYAYNTGSRGFEKYSIAKSDLNEIAETIAHASDHHADKYPGLICRRDREAQIIRAAATL
jgi:GH24 family phage-related lysozyme (muramidase)